MKGITKTMKDDVKGIFIFDLDGTIDKDVLNSPNKINKIYQGILDTHNTRDSEFYILTARRLNDFKDVNNCMCYNIPKKITDLFKLINQTKTQKGKRWFYYNENLDETLAYVKQYLSELGLIDKALKYAEVKDADDAANFFMGIQKMLQIEEMLDKYKDKMVSISFLTTQVIIKKHTNFIKNILTLTLNMFNFLVVKINLFSIFVKAGSAEPFGSANSRCVPPKGSAAP